MSAHSSHAISPVDAELQTLATSSGAYGFYRLRNVAVNVWSAPPSPAAVRTLAELTEQSLIACPTGICSIHVVEPGMRLPEQEARDGLSLIAKRYEHHLICVCVLLRGSGFMVSAQRSALSGIALLSLKRFPLRFFTEAPELASFAVQQLRQRLPNEHAPSAGLLTSLLYRCSDDAHVPRA